MRGAENTKNDSNDSRSYEIPKTAEVNAGEEVMGGRKDKGKQIMIQTVPHSMPNTIINAGSLVIKEGGKNVGSELHGITNSGVLISEKKRRIGDVLECEGHVAVGDVDMSGQKHGEERTNMHFLMAGFGSQACQKQ